MHHIHKTFTTSDTINSYNLQKLKKPFGEICIWLGILAIILILAVSLCFADCLSLNQVTFLGIAGSTGISIVIVLVTINNENRRDYFEARKCASMLCDILEAVNQQISSLAASPASKRMPSIIYPNNWFDLYKQCSPYLKYNYTNNLLDEFTLVDMLNNYIAEKDDASAKALLEARRYRIINSRNDFDIFSTMINLGIFAAGKKELFSWKADKSFIAFESFFQKNYTERVKNLTVEYLNAHSGNGSAIDASNYVQEKLKDDHSLMAGKYKREVLNVKKLQSAIYNVYILIANLMIPTAFAGVN